ncbi:hypothetical protein NLJ89_g7430 [Agrocybe chaxingu]|uniref:Uncharacterized protein n=1 Tax=Agrocybe chaxingu TaxID=84603 RepID=A0A9W8MVG3_9AGAR|nr:hypothetical protein NLJ89_g7430 [Agrocybe chaxingu]
MPPPHPDSSTSTSATLSAKSTSNNCIRDSDGRFRCLLRTTKPAFTDTEEDIVRHLKTTEVHNPGKVRCKGVLGK